MKRSDYEEYAESIRNSGVSLESRKVLMDALELRWDKQLELYQWANYYKLIGQSRVSCRECGFEFAPVERGQQFCSSGCAEPIRYSH